MVKIVEKWRAKRSYALRSPELFGSKVIGTLFATQPKSLLNRIVALPLRDLTGSPAHLYTIARLRVVSVDGEARTRLIGHEVAREWLGTFIRRRRKVLDIVFNVKVRDAMLTLKGFVVAQRCSAAQRRALRKIFIECIAARASSLTCADFYNWLFSGEAMKEATRALGRVVPIHKAEIRASAVHEASAGAGNA